MSQWENTAWTDEYKGLLMRKTVNGIFMGHTQAGHFEAQIVCIFWRCFDFQKQNLAHRGIKDDILFKPFFLQYYWILCDSGGP